MAAGEWTRRSRSQSRRASPMKPSLVRTFDQAGEFVLDANVDRVKSVRDKLHQDQLGARENIDWHAFSYGDAFTPALLTLQCLLRRGQEQVPEDTNLKA